MTHEEIIALSDREKPAIEQIAKERGITFEEAVNQLFFEGLNRRMRRRTKRAPCSNVAQFKR